MSTTTTLRYTIQINGVNADPDSNSVTIPSSPGITEYPSGTPVPGISYPVTMTRLAAGIYSTSITDPGYNLVYQFSPQASFNGAVTTLPQITVSGTQSPYSTTNLPQTPQAYNVPAIAQGTTPQITFPALTDSTGNAVVLTGKSINLIMYFDNGAVQIGQYSLSGSVGGSSNNIVAVTMTTASTANSCVYQYDLLDATDNVVLFQGVLPISAARLTVP